MTLAGIDVSAAGQGGAFPWADWKGKIAFAGVKISEGTGFADPDAARNIEQARAIGVAVIGYHFLHASLSGSGQAEHFLSCAEAAGLGEPGDLFALDAEDAGLDGEPYVQMNLTASAFTGEIRRHPRYVSYWPLAYTEISMAPSLVSLANCPLWLADLTDPKMTRVGPWSLVSIWQTGQRGVDADVFNGDAAQLAALGILGARGVGSRDGRRGRPRHAARPAADVAHPAQPAGLRAQGLP